MPTVYHLALMAEDIYTQDASGIYAASFPNPPPPGLPDRASLTRVAQTRDATFAAAVYKTDDDMTIVYRGTDTAAAALQSDENAQSVRPQFARAVAFAKDAIKAHGLTPAQTCLCGHSMGGTLAEYVAYKLEEQGWKAAAAVCFNAPGLMASRFDKALVAGMTQLTEDHAVGEGISAVHEMMQTADTAQFDSSEAHVISISLDGDIASKIGEVPGPSFVLKAPDFVVPGDFELQGGPKLPDSEYARHMLLREMYLHSIHTLRRVLADDPLGQQNVADLLDNLAS